MMSDGERQSGRSPYVSRAGLKLEYALRAFAISPKDWPCADLGANVGGFTDCLLQHGAASVYAVERGYGVLDDRLRRDVRVVAMERTDALSVTIPRGVRLVVVDAGWTRQHLILAAARRMLSADGIVISLIKPHYEADPSRLVRGVLPDEYVDETLEAVRHTVAEAGWKIAGQTESPIRGRGGNREWLWLLEPSADAAEMTTNVVSAATRPSRRQACRSSYKRSARRRDPRRRR
jgi:23S rRNA (cytidine1920-2'-O)/16S rRNA (cytidine1409-2'-O)-methyltransferase